MAAQNARRPSTSMPVVGSSRSSSAGSESSAIAKRSRCCSPPEHFATRRSAMPVIPALSSTSSTGLVSANRLAVYCTVSRTVRSLSRPPVCITAATSPRAIAWRGCIPRTSTSPVVGRDRPRIMSIVVVFPAPLGPRNATISPGSISRSMPRTACTRPKSLVTPPSRTAGVFCVVMRPAWSSRVPHPPIARHDSPVTSVRQFADRAVLVACSSLTGRFWLIVVRREGSSGDRRATKSARSTSSERPQVPSRWARDHQKCPVAGLEAELAELAGVALPVLGDLHVQVEVDRGAEEGLDLLAGLDADVAQAGALVADDDALLGVAFDVEAGVDLEQRFVGGAAL